MNATAQTIGNDTILDCGHVPSAHGPHTTGYGRDGDTGRTFCYECAAEIDRQWMRDHDRTTLYLVERTSGQWELTNWPGTLRLSPYRVRIGRHNMARKRYDAWVSFEGADWHFVTYGDNTQIAHGRRTK